MLGKKNRIKDITATLGSAVIPWKWRFYVQWEKTVTNHGAAMQGSASAARKLWAQGAHHGNRGDSSCEIF